MASLKMRELRRDPIIGRWVIIATERAKRPSDFAVAAKEAEPERKKDCPFCEGNESMTPPELMAVRKEDISPNGPGWKVRVIPGISDFLNTKGDLDRHGRGIYDLMNGIGVHDVIVMTPRHGIGINDMDSAELSGVMEVMIKRVKELRKDTRLKYALIFKNHGKVAGGGKLGHLHMQLIATPVTPKRVKEELAGAKRYFDYKDRCIFCDMIKQELKEDMRISCKADGFLAINPFCSRFPFETWILPARHSCDFDSMGKEEMLNFGNIFKEVFVKMHKLLGDFPYNTILHTAPFRRRRKKSYWETIEEDYHWHVEIMPRLTQVAGFEWGSGFYINSVSPEDACKFMKKAGV